VREPISSRQIHSAALMDAPSERFGSASFVGVTTLSPYSSEVVCRRSRSGDYFHLIMLRRKTRANERPGVDAGWRVSFAFQRPWSRATQGERWDTT
jgi:hypothetical protein